MLTNRMNLPQGVVNAVANDPYSKGDSDYSVTGLIAPPYQRRLREQVEVIEDVSDRIWSLIGQATHTILERAYPSPLPGDAGTYAERYAKRGFLVEERLFATVSIDGAERRVSGQFDVFEGGCLHDYKVTSVWSVLGDAKAEWGQQLNMLRALAHLNGLGEFVSSLAIIAILRDWSKAKARVDKEYPQAQVVRVEIPMWPMQDALDFMHERVRLHMDPNPPPCSRAERWATEDVWAVMKEGRKSAVKLHESEQAAIAHAAQLGRGHTVIKRPGEFKRCIDYCNVAHACPQMKSEVPF